MKCMEEWEGDFVRSFLGNPDRLKYIMNNIFKLAYFSLIFWICGPWHIVKIMGY